MSLREIFFKTRNTAIIALATFVIIFFVFRIMTMQEYTFSIIKPDATSRGLTKEINTLFTDKGLVVVEQKTIRMTKKQAQEFYIEHKNRPFYDSLVEYMTSGPIVVQVLKGKNAIKLNREIMGATNPKDAAPGTIRALYAESLDRNSVHGSDSPEAAKREISMFFDYKEVTSK